MGDAPANRLAFEVWGDPIEHSLSPRIHRAAYARLGWDWSYGRRRVDGDSFTAELGDLDENVRGLSLTFPLKTAAFAAATTRDRTAELTGAVNTLVRSDGALHGYNTDVGGLVADIGAHGFAHFFHALVNGAVGAFGRQRAAHQAAAQQVKARVPAPFEFVLLLDALQVFFFPA